MVVAPEFALFIYKNLQKKLLLGFLKRFLNVTNPAQVMKGSKDLKSVAFKTAEISSIQISSNKIRQRRVTDKFISFEQIRFFCPHNFFPYG
jgi:hypothetical protein